MTASPSNNALPLHEPDLPRFEAAARLLEAALECGPFDPNVAYQLAVVRKRQGKINEARAAFRKIGGDDANVHLQLGLLSYKENQFAQAEQEFEQAWRLDSTCYAAGYNLLLARLCQGKFDASVLLLGSLLPLADEKNRQSLTLLTRLLERCRTNHSEHDGELAAAQANGALPDDRLATMPPEDEKRLLSILIGLGQMEAVTPLFRCLVVARPESSAVQEALATSLLLQAKKLIEHCQWEAALNALAPLAASFMDGNSACRQLPNNFKLATYNLLGGCQCMVQDYERSVGSFRLAIKLSPNDPCLHQNLALAFELQGQFDQADSPWNRYFELQNRLPSAQAANYRDSLAYEGLNRLAECFSKKERWNTALTYLQRACRVRPGDFDSLERLFHMYNQVKRPKDARRTLQRLRELRPTDPQLDMYELDLREIKTLEDMERTLADVRKLLAKHPNDMRVEEKGMTMVANVIPLIRRMSDQYTDQLARVMEQLRRLPNYQVNWPAVHNMMRDLQHEFQKLRRLANKCLTLVGTEEFKGAIRDIIDHIDRKIDVCQSMGE